MAPSGEFVVVHGTEVVLRHYRTHRVEDKAKETTEERHCTGVDSFLQEDYNSVHSGEPLVPEVHFYTADLGQRLEVDTAQGDGSLFQESVLFLLEGIQVGGTHGSVF